MKKHELLTEVADPCSCLFQKSGLRLSTGAVEEWFPAEYSVKCVLYVDVCISLCISSRFEDVTLLFFQFSSDCTAACPFDLPMLQFLLPSLKIEKEEVFK